MANEDKIVDRMSRTCGNCIYGKFEDNDIVGSRNWDGVCIAPKVIVKSPESRCKEPSGHSVSQHFRCSNNMFRPR